MSCGICDAEQNLFCSGCCNYMFLRSRVTLIKTLSQVSELQTQVTQLVSGNEPREPREPRESRELRELGESREHGGSEKFENSGKSEGGSRPSGPCNSGNCAHISQLQARINSLESQIRRQKECVAETKASTTKIRLDIERLKQLESDTHAKKLEIEEASQMVFKSAEMARHSKEGLLETGYRDMLLLSLHLQAEYLHDFLEVFKLKRKRKQNGFEIVLGQNVVPELGSLGHYSTAVINSGMDRVCYFTALLAKYTSQTLPYPLLLPTTKQPKVLIHSISRSFNLSDSNGETQSLYLHHSVKTMTRSSPREFYTYCKLLSMLYIDVAFLATRLGVVRITDLEDTAKLGHNLTQIYLQIENSLQTGARLPISASPLDVDLDALQEYLITTIDVALNGRSAEWNLVEVPE